MKGHGFVVNLQVYPFDILVWFGSTDSMGKWLKKYLAKEDVEALLSHEFRKGKCAMLPTGQTVLWLPRVPQDAGDMATLSHEIFHAVCFILDKIGMRLDDSSEEAYAYLIQYVSKQIYQKIPFN